MFDIIGKNNFLHAGHDGTNVPLCPAGGITPPPYFPIGDWNPFPVPHSQPNGQPIRQLAKPYPENPHDPERIHGLASRHDRHR